ncbi:MAG TPA: flavodoxin family protein [Dehalococcoidales bacterium]|nr:flavodoxin family protein [Dehalococcoidales bacterium]
MKVLGIVCSPRKKGNTEIMVEEALAAAREAGAETEIVLIAGQHIEGCDACGSCFKTGRCKIKDDMEPIYGKMEAADGIIFGSPVYFHSVTAQAKAVMDRTFCYLRNRKLMGKVGAPMLALRKIGAGQTRTMLYGYFLAQGMVPVRGGIGYGREKGDVREGEGARIGFSAIEEARSVGVDVVDMVKRLGGTG